MVLRDQIKYSGESILITPSSKGIAPTHPVNAGTRKVYEAVKETVPKSASSLVAWKDLRMDGLQSIAGAIQKLYSDKSQTFLPAEALDFCPFQNTYVNLTENCTRSRILTGLSIVTYLLV